MPILNKQETMEYFDIKSPTTALQLFRTKGSPAFKVGKNWRIDREEFKEFLKEQSEKFKG